MTEAGPFHDSATTWFGVPSSYVQISGPHELLDDPRELIRQAIRTLKTSKAPGSRHRATATKVFGLLYAASLRAKSIGKWHSSHPYSPYADFLQLKALARDRLGPLRPPKEMVSLVRSAIDDSILDLSELAE